MDEIKAELSARLPSGVAFEIPLFGGIPVPQSTVMTWIIIGVITVLCIWLTHNLKERPGRRQMVAEVLVGFINNFCKENLGKHWRTFAPYLGTVAVYLVVSNTCGLFGFTPPTKDLNVAAAMELIKIVCPLVLPIPFSLYFDIFDGILQAVVFVFLTTLFLSESLED